MAGFFRKGVVKLKLILRPKAHSRITKGFGSGLIWTHKVSDLRYLLGEYEPELAIWLKSKMEQGYSFIDIGANAGYFSLLASKYSKSKTQRIIAVEPIKENLRLISNHIELNHLNSIEVLPIAVADNDRVVEFSASSNLAANTYSETSSLHKNSPKIPIEAKCLDSICDKLELKNFVVKIDVEGAELDVLKGAKNTLIIHKPELMLATHECHSKGVERDCIDFLKKLNYHCEPIKEEKFVPGQQDYLCIFRDLSK